MDKLKPCPFCGAIMNLSKDGELVAWHDSSCFFVLLEDGELNLTDEQLNDSFVKAWNRRVNNGKELL